VRSVCPLLRQRRCDTIVYSGYRRILQAHKRHRDGAGAVAACTGGVALDRYLLRSGRRWLCRVPPQKRERLGKSRVEEFTRRDLPRGRPDGGRPSCVLVRGPIDLCSGAGGTKRPCRVVASGYAVDWDCRSRACATGCPNPARRGLLFRMGGANRRGFVRALQPDVIS
jgi:hypothetical protein